MHLNEAGEFPVLPGARRCSGGLLAAFLLLRGVHQQSAPAEWMEIMIQEWHRAPNVRGRRVQRPAPAEAKRERVRSCSPGGCWFPLGTPARTGWGGRDPQVSPEAKPRPGGCCPEPTAHPSGRAPGLAPAVSSTVTPAVSERRIPVAKIWIWF